MEEEFVKQAVNRMNEAERNLYKDHVNKATFSWEKSALIIVDFQNDFINGSLRVDTAPAKQDPVKYIPTMNKFLQEKFKVVVLSRDWHPQDHISFFENLHKWELHPDSQISNKSNAKVFDSVVFANQTGKPYPQILWPTHCIKESKGAEFHPNLKIPDSALIVNKGEISDLECYSAFGLVDKRANTGLQDILARHGIDTVFVCGIATEWCVAATCRDASSLGLRVNLVQDLCSGIDPDRIKQVLTELNEKHLVHLSKTEEIYEILNGSLNPGIFQLRSFLKPGE